MSDRPELRAAIGMKVHGEFGTGRIIAMTKVWCIYEVTEKNGTTVEQAEPWDCIVAALEPALSAVSTITEGPAIPVAED